MLSGKDLGRAIEQAIKKKLSSGTAKTKAEIARHFNIKPPSIHDWINRGSISKEKLPELWNYFSDVVGPEHWGLKDFPHQSATQDNPRDLAEHDRVANLYIQASPERKAVVDYLLSSSYGEQPTWVDSDVRAYVTTLDSKARLWLEEKNTKSRQILLSKTGT